MSFYAEKGVRVVRLLLTSAAFVAVALLLPAVAAALPPQPALGTAVVDGQYAEWNLTTDFFADMYRAGDPTKKTESKLYLRFDCRTRVMYALVLVEPDVVGYIDTGATTAWIAVGAQHTKVAGEESGDDGIPPDFAWIGRGYDGNPLHVRGFEASFYIMPGTTIILAHINVWDDAEDQTSSTGYPGVGPRLEIPQIPSAVEPATFGAIKALYR